MKDVVKSVFNKTVNGVKRKFITRKLAVAAPAGIEAVVEYRLVKIPLLPRSKCYEYIKVYTDCSNKPKSVVFTPADRRYTGKFDVNSYYDNGCFRIYTSQALHDAKLV